MTKYLISALCLISLPAMANSFQLSSHYASINYALTSGAASYSNVPNGYSAESDIVGSLIAVGAQLTKIEYKMEGKKCFAGLTFKKDGKDVVGQRIWIGGMEKVGQSEGLCQISHVVSAD